MTQIRIRHEDEPVGAILGDVPFADVDSVIRLLKMWGVKILADGDYANHDEYSGEFVYDADSREVYFEVEIV